MGLMLKCAALSSDTRRASLLHPGVMVQRENMAPDSGSLKATVATSPASPLWYTHSYDWPILYNLVGRLTPLMPRPVRFALANVVAAFFRWLMPREYAAA